MYNSMNNYVYLIDKSTHTDDIGINDISRINDEVRDCVTKLKNNIPHDDSWDHAKRKINEYENIFSSAKKPVKICKKKSLSRAYFKLWEILYDFHPEIFGKYKKINTAHLAEGPGGFIECLIDYKNKFNITVKQIFGITLLVQSGTDNRVPFWKLSKDTCVENNVCINRRADNIGDMYQMKCINNFVKRVGHNTCELVTADGGFDFSTDFNSQEKVFQKLFLSELFTAAQIQKYGGSFIIKVFDMFTMETSCLVSILYELYEQIYIIKPFTSRPANSEKYLVCLNYKTNNKNLTILNDCKNELLCNKGILKSLGKYMNENVACRLCVYNAYYASRQMYYLDKTLREANTKDTDRNRLQSFDNAKNKCIDWCDHYELDHV